MANTESRQSRAKAGDAEAMIELGESALDRGNITKAREWFLKALETGSPDAKFFLGVAAQDEGDLATALEWYLKAALDGDTLAMNNYGWLTKEAGDLETAREWLQRSAEGGEAHGMASLAALLGEIGDEDGEIHWTYEAAEAGSARAMNWVGVWAAEAQKREEALEWFEKAAASGDAEATVNARRMRKEIARLKESYSPERNVPPGPDVQMSEIEEIVLNPGAGDDLLYLLMEGRVPPELVDRVLALEDEDGEYSHHRTLFATNCAHLTADQWMKLAKDDHYEVVEAVVDGADGITNVTQEALAEAKRALNEDFN